MTAMLRKTRTDGIVVPARSKENIAACAAILRKHINLTAKANFPVDKVYEALGLLYEGADFEVREDHEMGDDHGRTYPDKNLILLRGDVYERGCAGNGRDRFTMCHELGHLMLHREVALSRIDPANPPKIYRNSEWQADTFASHLMMPAILLAECRTISEVQDKFGVSFDAAHARRSEMKNA